MGYSGTGKNCSWTTTKLLLLPVGTDCVPSKLSSVNHVADERTIGPRERFEAIARSARDILSHHWVLTSNTYERENPKRVYYLSMEFLLGRSLANNITNLLLDPFVTKR
jgi:glucan phosphorylase